MRVNRRAQRRKHLLLIVVLAVKLLVPVEAGGLQGLFTGSALHALLMPKAVVEPKQKSVRDDPLTAFADRFGAHRSAYGSKRHSPMSHLCKPTPLKHSGDRILPFTPRPWSMHSPGRSPMIRYFKKLNQVAMTLLINED